MCILVYCSVLYSTQYYTVMYCAVVYCAVLAPFSTDEYSSLGMERLKRCIVVYCTSGQYNPITLGVFV